MEHITLPALDEARQKVETREVLEATAGPGGTFTLLHSPALVDGLAGGDTIQLAPDLLCGFRLVQRGRNVALVLVLGSAEEKAAEGTRALLAQVADLGATCDGGPRQMLVFTVPVGKAFGALEAAFDGFCQRTAGATWWFGNVYGADGKPLNWWR
jgi:Domain of unknown function (DUF4265)